MPPSRMSGGARDAGRQLKLSHVAALSLLGAGVLYVAFPAKDSVQLAGFDQLIGWADRLNHHDSTGRDCQIPAMTMEDAAVPTEFDRHNRACFASADLEALVYSASENAYTAIYRCEHRGHVGELKLILRPEPPASVPSSDCIYAYFPAEESVPLGRATSSPYERHDGVFAIP